MERGVSCFTCIYKNGTGSAKRNGGEEKCKLGYFQEGDECQCCFWDNTNAED